MSLSQKVADAVDKAFLAAGDVRIGVKLEGDSVSGFDHATQKIVEGAAIPPVVVLGIQTGRKINRDGVEEVKYLFKYSEVSINTYKTLTDPTGTYKITSWTPTMTYIVEVTATKEK